MYLHMCMCLLQKQYIYIPGAHMLELFFSTSSKSSSSLFISSSSSEQADFDFEGATYHINCLKFILNLSNLFYQIFLTDLMKAYQCHLLTELCPF